VASLHARKGHSIALRAARVLKDQGKKIRWVFCGDGPERVPLMRQAAELHLDGNVIFTGFRSDIRSVISGLDVFVLPSLMEGLGVSLIEAMAMGKPVVASRVGGIPEIVTDGETGFLVPPGSPEGIVARVGELLLNEGLRNKMGMNGKRVVLQKFTMERMARQNELFYHQLCRERIS
jgi:glycosyltransferase involved in cell wall biosynthesis